MDYQIEQRTLTPQAAMVCHQQVHHDKLAEAFGHMLGRAYGYVSAHGGTPVEPPLAYYHGVGTDVFDISCGCRIADPLAEGDGIEVLQLPAGEAAVTDHYGPYGELGAAHQALEAWIREQGREPADPAWELYWTDPGAEPDPAKWRTEVFRLMQ